MVPVALVCIAAPVSSGAAVRQKPAVWNVSLSVGTGGKAAPAKNLAPGDAFTQAIDVTLGGRAGARVDLVISSAAKSSSLLDQDARSGLRVGVDICAAKAGWRRKPGGSEQCAGRIVHVLKRRPVATIKNTAVRLTSLVPGVPSHYLVTLTLPSSAGNAFEGRVTLLRFTFLARP